MNKQKRVILYIPEEDYRKLKSNLSLLGKSVSGWFRERVKELLDK